MLSSLLHTYKSEIEQELDNILQYWINNTVDTVHGGFYGKLDNNNQVFAEAPKGSVLNARILWTFSAAWNVQKDHQYLAMADRAFEFINRYFIDEEYGGVYWSLDYAGKPLDTKKQVYAIAFVIYACSEYFRATKNDQAKEIAINLFYLLQQHSYDKIDGGYLEAFTRDWQPIADLRLSNKDANEKKTANTHLHVLEAYANLYLIWPGSELANSIAALLGDFYDHMINKESFHLDMFFDEKWNIKAESISFGHDIEASWLLLEVAEILEDENWIEKMRSNALKMAEAAAEGLDKDGGLWYEIEPAKHGLIKEKHWWPQAEALVGFLNAWQVSGDKKYLDYVLNTWGFIQRHILDKQYGEWFWGVKSDYSIMPGEDKVGIWKCPYHNGRACLETIRRLQA
jgi:mannobiose 2-epimerase